MSEQERQWLADFIARTVKEAGASSGQFEGFESNGEPVIELFFDMVVAS